MIPSISPLYFLLLLPILQPSTTTAHPAPPPFSPNPNRQPAPTHLHQTISSPLHCIPAPPFSLPAIDAQTCLTHTIPSICAKLTFPFPPRGVWQWVCNLNPPFPILLPLPQNSPKYIEPVLKKVSPTTTKKKKQASYPSCSMGFYLPPSLPRGAGVPTKQECIETVFGDMVTKCLLGGRTEKGGGKAGAAAGLGMRNVRSLPTRGDVGLGVVEGKARFLMGGSVLGG